MRRIVTSIKDGVIRRFRAAQSWTASYRPDLFWSVSRAREPRVAPAPRRADNVEVRADAEFAPFVVTTANGVYICSPGSVLRWLEGSYYGLAWDADRVFLVQRGATRATRRPFRTLLPDPDLLLRVIAEPSDGRPRLLEEVTISKRFDVHSLDVLEGRVYVTLSAQNSLLVYDPGLRRGVVARIGPRSYKDGAAYVRLYRHLNSVFLEGESAWLMAHNDTSYTGRNSEILRVSRKALDDGHRGVQPAETIPTGGSHAHNLFRVGGASYWCDSYGYSAKRDDEVIAAFEEPYFTRGLDWDGATLVVGGSRLEKQREARKEQDGVVGIWRYRGRGAGERAGTITIRRSGHVCDVRFLERSRGMSSAQGAPAWLRALIVSQGAAVT